MVTTQFGPIYASATHPVAPEAPRRRAHRFGASGGSSYDAVKNKGKRQAPTSNLRAEDAELGPLERKRMLSAARTLHRNYAVAAWMIRTHLNYVSTFSFQPRSDNKELNKTLERLVKWWGKPGNFDYTGRFSRRQFIRQAECRRTVDGDMGVVKLARGLVQAIEGDRIRTPTGGMPNGRTAAEYSHGVRTNKAGRPLEYSICKRGPTTDSGGRPSQFTFERMVRARNLYHFGYFDRFDQLRGISPLATAVNTLRDTYEVFDYAVAKMKVSQLLGLIIFSEKADDAIDLYGDDANHNVGEEATGGEDSAATYDVDLGNGPFKLELDTGDKAEFIESKSPAQEGQAFSRLLIEVALKALDIPFSFYSENYTNYSGARQALLQYELAADVKRDDVRDMLDHLTEWRCRLWILDGVLPGVSLSDLRWEWVPNGISWIDPLKEVMAQLAAIGGGLTSRTAVCRSWGENWFDVLAQLTEEQRAMVAAGLTPTIDPKNADLISAAAQNDAQEQKGSK